MSQCLLFKQVQLPNSSSIRIIHHRYCFKTVIALNNLCIRFTFASKGNYACFLIFTLMLSYSNVKKEKQTFFILLLT